MIRELDRVVLTKDIPADRLKIGDVGTVVLVYPDARAYEVEFVTLGGDTLAVVQIKSDAVRPVAPDEITHARKVA